MRDILIKIIEKAKSEWKPTERCAYINFRDCDRQKDWGCDQCLAAVKTPAPKVAADKILSLFKEMGIDLSDIEEIK